MKKGREHTRVATLIDPVIDRIHLLVL